MQNILKLAHGKSSRSFLVPGSLLRKAYYASVLVKKGGWGIILRYLLSGLFSRTTYIWLAKELNSGESYIPAAIRYSLQPASPNVFEKLQHGLNGERGQALFEVLRRVSFYKRGFDTCYFAATDSGDMCFMQWLISPDYNDLIRASYPFAMRELRGDEVMVENGFTFPRYRKKGIMVSVMLDLAEIASKRGFSRMVTQVNKENKASLKGCYRAGFRPFSEEREIKFLFCTWRRKGYSS